MEYITGTYEPNPGSKIDSVKSPAIAIIAEDVRKKKYRASGSSGGASLSDIFPILPR